MGYHSFCRIWAKWCTLLIPYLCHAQLSAVGATFFPSTVFGAKAQHYLDGIPKRSWAKRIGSDESDPKAFIARFWKAKSFLLEFGIYPKISHGARWMDAFIIAIVVYGCARSGRCYEQCDFFLREKLSEKHSGHIFAEASALRNERSCPKIINGIFWMYARSNNGVLYVRRMQVSGAEL